jgi:hypothetical protein
MKHAIGARQLANPNCACSHLLQKVPKLIQVTNSLSNWRFSYSLSVHIGPPIMLTTEPRMVNTFNTCGPTSFKHVSFDVHVSTQIQVYCCVWCKHIYLIKNVRFNIWEYSKLYPTYPHLPIDSTDKHGWNTLTNIIRMERLIAPKL